MPSFTLHAPQPSPPPRGRSLHTHVGEECGGGGVRGDAVGGHLGSEALRLAREAAAQAVGEEGVVARRVEPRAALLQPVLENQRLAVGPTPARPPRPSAPAAALPRPASPPPPQTLGSPRRTRRPPGRGGAPPRARRQACRGRRGRRRAPTAGPARRASGTRRAPRPAPPAPAQRGARSVSRTRGPRRRAERESSEPPRPGGRQTSAVRPAAA